jgi:hypothetical protein
MSQVNIEIFILLIDIDQNDQSSLISEHKVESQTDMEMDLRRSIPAT